MGASRHEILEVLLAGGAMARVRRCGNLSGVGPRLFLSHGNGFAIDGYRRFWERWLQHFELILYDQRNHGANNPSAPADHHYPQMAADLQVIHDAVGKAWGERHGVGVYHSLSARIALLHLQRYGWIWDALVLFDPPTIPPAGEAREAMVRFDQRLAEWAESRPGKFTDPEELADQLRQTRAHAGWEQGSHLEMARAILRESGSDWILRCPGPLEAGIYTANPGMNLWPRKGDHSDGILLLGADPDLAHASPTAAANVELAQAGGYDYAAVTGCGHLMQLEQPATCRALVENYLSARGLL